MTCDLAPVCSLLDENLKTQLPIRASEKRETRETNTMRSIRFLLRLVLVLAIVGANAQSVLAEVFTPTETEEAVWRDSGGWEYIRRGAVDGFKYLYTLLPDGSARSGLVNGPIPPPEDGDRSQDADTWFVLATTFGSRGEIRCKVGNRVTGLTLRMEGPDRIARICVYRPDESSGPCWVRVDEHEPIVFRYDRCHERHTDTLMAQLREGRKLFVGDYEWPGRYLNSTEGDSLPFGQTLSLLAYMMRQGS